MKQKVVAGALLAMLAATSGCSKQATGQSVAVVNDEEISQGELNDELTAANVPESADKKQVMPQLLQRVIDRRLVAQKAAEDGLDRSPEYLSQQRRMNENLLIQLYTRRQADTIKPPTQAEIDAFVASNPNMFGQREALLLNQIAFDRPADISLLQQLRDDHSLDAVAATLGRLGIPFQRGQGRLDSGTVPPQIAQQIRSLPPGEPFVAPAGNRIVVSVVGERQPVTVTSEQTRQIATEALRRQKLQQLLEGQLKELRTSAKIEYQPGYEPKEPAAGAKGKAETGAGAKTTAK